jgi:hypothetical protein
LLKILQLSNDFYIIDDLNNLNMKKLLFILFLFVACFVQSQIINFNTQALGTGYTGSNGAGGITFVIVNTNPYPVYLKQINNFQTSATTLTNVTLYHSFTSLSGAPGNITTSPNWILDLTVPSVTISSAGAQDTILSGLNIQIPANDTMRFHLGSTQTISYTTAGVGVTPNNFTNAGVKLLVGDAQIASASIGYGGPATAPTNNPRAFTGTLIIDATPATPCSGSPIAGSTSANDTNVCVGQTLFFNLSGLVGASGQTFQWRENGTNLLNDTNSFLVKTITAANTYDCIVTCNNSGLTTISTPLSIILNPFSSCYCPITATGTTGADIGNVTIGTFTNGVATPIVGNTSANKTYTNFTGLGPIPIFSGTLNSFSIASITSVAAPTATTVITTNVFIDYNQNGIYDPINELAFSGTGNFVGNNIASGNPLIPATALSGVTGMRVMVYQSTAFGPCGPTSATLQGETEDYLVDIQPAAVCTGVPNASSVASTDSTVCSGINFTLSIPGATSGLGISYQWQANGTNLVNDTLPTLTTSITANTTFTCLVSCVASGQSATSNALLMTVNPFSVCYCPITATGTTGADIGNVTIGAFTNGSAAPIVGNTAANKTYTNFTNLGPVPIFSGAPNPISIAAITSVAAPTATTIITTNVFIDYNQNGVYDPINELAFSGTGNFVGNNIATGNPLIPATALSGITGMRVMVYQSTAFSPCGPTSATLQGETEDYLVDIQPSTLCSGTPNAGSVASTDTTVCPGTSFTLSIPGATNGSGITYQWQANGTNLLNDTLPTLTKNISANTIYTCVVTCAASGQSSTSTALTVLVNPPTACYCVTGLGGFCTSTPISNVTIVGTALNDNTPCATVNGQAYNFVAPGPTSSATLIKNQTYTLSVSTTAGSPLNVRAYIDYNANGSWTDPGEEIVICTSCGATGPYTIAFTVPSNAVTDSVRLRVRTRSGTIASACESIGSGSTHDYVVYLDPGTACTGTPSVTGTAASDTLVCPNKPVTFTLTGTTPASGLSYQWQLNGANLPGDTNVFLIDTITAGGTYQCVITCLASGLSATSAPLTVGLDSQFNCYCTSTATNTADDDIGIFSFGPLNNVSCATALTQPLNNPCSNNLYTSFTSLGATVLNSPLSYPISITQVNSAGSFGCDAKVFIDYNRDGTFQDPAEVVFAGSTYTGAITNILSGNVTIPPLAPGLVDTGLTLMRVVLNETGIPTACGTYSWGETEDYLVNIQAAIACTGAPNAGNVSTADTSVCLGQIITFNLSGQSQNSGLTYQWQENGVNIPGATGLTLTDTVSGASTYQCVITCTASGQSTTSTSVTLTVNPFSVCYCAINNTGATGTDIGNVTVGGFSNGVASPITGNATANKTYSNFTNLAPIPLFSGAANAMSYSAITSAASSTVTVTGRLFIDYNHDGTYDPFNELVLNGTANYTTSNTISGAPIIPSTALTGVTGMRVMMYDVTTYTPCGTTSLFTAGETEDYLVDIQPSTLCSGTPNAGAISSSDTSVCPNSAFTLSLQGATIGGGISYQWQANGVNLPNDTLPNLTTSITANTTYTCIVTCTPSSSSSTSSPLTVVVNPPNNCYCFTGLGGSCTSVPINTFKISKKVGATFQATTLDNTSGCVAVGGQAYSAYPIVYGQYAELSPADTFQLSVTTGSGTPTQVKLWIDWNNDGVWNNTNELKTICAAAPSTPCITGTNTSSFLLDPSATVGDTVRMRLRTRAATITDACQNIATGETEDYFLIVGSNTILSVNQLNNKAITDVKIYPNPTDGTLNYELPTDAKNVSVIVSDLLGRVVLNRTNIAVGNASLDLTQLNNGSYNIVFNNNGQIIQKKIVVNK